jgi:hypothetical protein
MAPFGPVVKMMVYSWLCAETIKIINVDTVTESPRLPRVEVKIEDMSEVGRA